jgi:hypothetical protein
MGNEELECWKIRTTENILLWLENHKYCGQWQSSSETHPSEQVPVSICGRRSWMKKHEICAGCPENNLKKKQPHWIKHETYVK